MKTTPFEKFAYQCHLNGVTFTEFCSLTGIAQDAALDLLTSSGGVKYLIRELAKLRESVITHGDVLQVQMVREKGAELFDAPYAERQKQLGALLMEIEGETE